MREFARDPFRIWKVLAMVMAAVVVGLCVSAVCFTANLNIVFAALGIGAVMCATSGIMALVKGRRVLGYLCSILAGAFLVLLLIWVLRNIWQWG